MNAKGKAPNEANLDEAVSSVEPKQPIEVTANFGAFSGLDNAARQPGEDSTPNHVSAMLGPLQMSNPVT
jgi:hypothetical protein